MKQLEQWEPEEGEDTDLHDLHSGWFRFRYFKDRKGCIISRYEIIAAFDLELVIIKQQLVLE